MRKPRRLPAAGIIRLSAFILTAVLLLLAQMRTSSGATLDLSALQLVDSNSVPASGNFYFAQNYGITSGSGLDAFGPPLPGDLRPDLPLYALGNGNYVIDNFDDTNAATQSAAMSRGGMMSMGADDSGGMMFSFSTDGLWLEMTGVSNGLAYVNLHNANNQVYKIMTKTDISLPDWTIENEVWPTNSTVMPFNISELGRTNLFVWAMDWTGVTENGNTTPDWWFWEYFGTTSLLDGDLDSLGRTLSHDYESGSDPNPIAFSLLVTNQNVSVSPTTVSLNIIQGMPFNLAVLVDDTNFADAVWAPYLSSNITVNLSGTGWHNVWVGLRGHAANSQQAWNYTTFNYLPPPVLIITNPVPGTTSRPVIQVQGFSATSLATVSYDLSNSSGTVLGQPGFVTSQYYDTNLSQITTNFFQCFDVPLALGTNVITLHAIDLAGNTTTTNLSFTLDYSGDTTPPVITVLYPLTSSFVGATNFTLLGQLDDDTAALTVSNTAVSQTVSALVERGGMFSATNLNLPGLTNQFIVFATDAAGNTSTQQLTVLRSSLVLTVDPLTPDQLSQPTISLSGTISDPSQNVWVNGNQAAVVGNSWAATIPAPITGSLAGLIQAGGTLSSPSADLAFAAPMPPTIQATSFTQEDFSYHHISRPQQINSDSTTSKTTARNWSFGVGGSSQQYRFNSVSGSCNSYVTWPTNWPGGTSLVGSSSCTDPYSESTPSAWRNCLFGYAKTDIAADDSGTFIWPESFIEKHSAQTLLQLNAGGAAQIGAQKLILLTATAAVYSSSDSDYDNPGDTPVLGSQIQYLGQKFTQTATNANAGQMLIPVAAGLTESLPIQVVDNNNVPLTNSSLNVLATNVNLVVMANGVALDPNTAVSSASFCVGQIVSFSMTNLPPGVTATNFQWSFGGNYFNAQSNAGPGTSVQTRSRVPYVDPALLARSAVTNWWVSGGTNVNTPATYIVSVACTLILTNSSLGLPYSTQGEFNMFRPQAKITPVTTSVNVQIVGNNLKLVFGSGTNNGIVFSNTLTIPSTFTGSVEWVQVVYMPVEEAIDTNGISHINVRSSGPYLDTTLPYSSFLFSGSPTPVDSPSLTLDTQIENYVWAVASDSFAMWMGFRPTGGHWVPLRVVTWSWSGTVTNSAVGWSLLSGTNSPNPTDFDTQVYPLWKSNVTNSAWVPPL